MKHTVIHPPYSGEVLDGDRGAVYDEAGCGQGGTFHWEGEELVLTNRFEGVGRVTVHIRELVSKWNHIVLERPHEAEECERFDFDFGGGCEGPVDSRSYDCPGAVHVMCEHHWGSYCEVREGIDERYPTHAPSDFDPSYAGESWE